MFTLYTSVAGSLPPTSYVKIIEIWLLFHLFVPFLIFLIIFKLEHIYRTNVKPFQEIAANAILETTLTFLGEKAIPSATFAFVVVYFAVCLIYYSY
jgi:hypothetical protein